MHPYILYKRISGVFVLLILISVVCALIVPVKFKLFCFGGFFVFVIFFSIFMEKALNYNEDEKKVVKNNMQKQFNSSLKLLKGWLILFAIVVVVAILKAVF